MLFFRVYHKDRAGQVPHVLNAAQIFLQLFNLMIELDDFLFREKVKRAVLLHFTKLLEAADTCLDGLEVGEHAAEPSRIDIVHAAAQRFLLDRVHRLLFGADEQDILPVLCQLADEHIRLFHFLYGLLQVDDIDTVALGKNILGHFGIPAPGLVPEMDARFQKLLH